MYCVTLTQGQPEQPESRVGAGGVGAGELASAGAADNPISAKMTAGTKKRRHNE